MGAKPHICSGPECPCYQCSQCKKRWLSRDRLKKHQLFECKPKLTLEQMQQDQRQDAARPVCVGPAAVPGPGPGPAAAAAPAPGLLQGDQPQAQHEHGRQERKRKASVEEICNLETELSDLYSTRSGAKRRLLEVVDGKEGSEDRAADIQQELQVCKEWESFCRGWMEQLDFPEGELELEREGVTSQLNNNSASIGAKLVEVEEKQIEQEQEQGSLHCSWCRGDFTRLYNLDHHRTCCPLAPRSQPDPYTLRLLEGEELEDTLDHLSTCSDYSKLILCHTMRVAVPTVWPPVFVGPGQRGKLDWLGDEIGFAHPTLPDILEKAVVEEGPVPLTEYITIIRKDNSSVFLGPSLTMPSRTFKKIEVKRTATRIFLDVKRGDKDEEERDDEDEEFNSMLKRRLEDLEEEERLDEEDLEEEEEEEERKGKEKKSKKPKDDNSKMDPEERRRLVRQGRSGGEGHIVEYLHSL